MTPDSWRCFVAVPLEDAIRVALISSVATWRRQPPGDGLRWSEPGGWHLTLAFLGGVKPDDVAAVVEAIGAVAAHHRPLRLSTGRLGAFPRPGSARVLWYGVADPDGALGAIAAALARALDIRVDEPYRPHVTLARARRSHADLRGWIESASTSAPEGVLHVRNLALMRSHLGPGPARYETLATLSLGDAR